MASPDFWRDQEKAQNLSRQHQNLKSKLGHWQDIKQEAEELEQLAEMIGDDEKEQTELMIRLAEVEKKFAALNFDLLFSGAHDGDNAIVSIHSGTGGVDAQDWAEILLRMILRFAERHDFSAKIIDKNEGSEAGIKSVTLSIEGDHVYGWLRSENGVHRLVRISPFDAEKMRHTSFALIEVLPELADDNNSLIKESDLKIEVMHASGHGGQSVNTTNSAVRITHIPTGLTVKCQNERSQVQNKANALKILQSKLAQIMEERGVDKLKEIRGEYQQAQWSNQSRSYVMQPYKLVKDHRTDHETPDIDRVLNGDFDDFVASFLESKLKK